MIKTTKNLLLLMVCGVMTAATLTACTDDDDNSNDSQKESTLKSADLVVDRWAQSISYEVKGEGAWHIETTDDFFAVEPEEGTGPATVTIYMQNNNLDERKNGSFKVVYPANESQNQTVTVAQKWKGEYDANTPSKYDTMNEIYAVGYSYDCTGEYASPNSVKLEVFDTHRLWDQKRMLIDSALVEMTVSTVTGSSISELSNQLAAKAEIKGGFGAFKAEANSSFDMSQAKKDIYEYAINYFDMQNRTARINLSRGQLRSKYMTSEAKAAINGTTPYYAGVEGIVNLIADYGTHVVMNSRLGGRLRQTLRVDISEINNSYDIKAYAKASYGGVFVKAEGSVDEHFQSAYKENKQYIDTRLSTLGGDNTKARKLNSQAGFTKDNLNEWAKSVNGSNSRLMGFGKDALVPLYELVDQVKYPERYTLMKAYMEDLTDNAMFGNPEYSAYDCGTTTLVKLPTFEKSNESCTTSLIHDIYLGGQRIGILCNEYIPIINTDSRVDVIYPVIGNKPRFNMGFYLGDPTHKPARVSWDGTSVAVEEYEDMPFGRADSIYLRGATVSVEVGLGLQARKGYTEPCCLRAPMSKEASIHFTLLPGGLFDYSLVKIFNKIWLRMDYAQPVNGSAERYHVRNGEYFGEGEYYPWSAITIKNNLDSWLPMGWHIASANEYKELKTVLDKYKISTFQGLTAEKTGFWLKYQGWFWGPDSFNRSEDEMQYAAPTKTGNTYTCDYVSFKRSGEMKTATDDSKSTLMRSIRLVKEY